MPSRYHSGRHSPGHSGAIPVSNVKPVSNGHQANSQPYQRAYKKRVKNGKPTGVASNHQTKAVPAAAQSHGIWYYLPLSITNMLPNSGSSTGSDILSSIETAIENLLTKIGL